MHVSWFNILMAGVLATLVTLISRIHAPRWKSFIYSFPIPFTLAFIVSGGRAHAGHAAGILLNHFFLWGVYGLYRGLGVRILLADVLMALLYLVVGLWTVYHLPVNEVWLLWALIGCGLGIAAASRWLPARREPGQTSPMAIWQKAGLVFLISMLLFSLKDYLLAAVTTFPYLGSFTVVECRKSLFTLARRFAHLSSAFFCLLAVLWLCQDRLGPLPALAVAWVPTVAVLAGIQFWSGRAAQENASPGGVPAAGTVASCLDGSGNASGTCR